MNAISYMLLCLVLVACSRNSPPKDHVLATNTPQTRAEVRKEREVPEPMKKELIEQALAVARANGRSVDDLRISVSDYGDSWMVWFTGPIPDKRQSGGVGFVVKIDKAGKSAQQNLKYQ